MTVRIFRLLVLVPGILFVTGCNNSKNEKTAKIEEKAVENTTEPAIASNNSVKIDAPDFADPELRKFYGDYTAFTEKVVTAIRNKDEAAAMSLFKEGNKFSNVNEMEQKALATEERILNTWLSQVVPYQTEIAKSEYFKKYNEEYYKKVKEDFDKKNK